MQIKSAIVILLIFAMITTPTVHAQMECSLKASCDAGEICWFSQSTEEDAHIADCSDPYSLQMCCTETENVAISTSWLDEEEEVMTLNDVGDAHISSFFDPFENKLCVEPTNLLLVAYSNTNDLESDGYNCLTSLSGQTDAHISHCDDPYQLKIFVRSQEPISEGHTMSVGFTNEDQDNSVAIQGSGEESAANLGITPIEYQSNYVISQGQGTAIAIVSGNNLANTVEASNDADSHTLKVTQPLDNNRFYIAFTKEGLDTITERYRLIETSEFESLSNPSFGYNLNSIAQITIGTSSISSIDISTSEVLEPGLHRIEIVKIDKQGNTNIVAVKRENT